MFDFYDTAFNTTRSDYRKVLCSRSLVDCSPSYEWSYCFCKRFTGSTTTYSCLYSGTSLKDGSGSISYSIPTPSRCAAWTDVREEGQWSNVQKSFFIITISSVVRLLNSYHDFDCVQSTNMEIKQDARRPNAKFIDKTKSIALPPTWVRSLYYPGNQECLDGCIGVVRILYSTKFKWDPGREQGIQRNFSWIRNSEDRQEHYRIFERFKEFTNQPKDHKTIRWVRWSSNDERIRGSSKGSEDPEISTFMRSSVTCHVEYMRDINIFITSTI